MLLFKIAYYYLSSYYDFSTNISKEDRKELEFDLTYLVSDDPSLEWGEPYKFEDGNIYHG